MTDRFETDEFEEQQFVPGRITYIKPTGSDEAHRLGLIPANIDLPEGMKLATQALVSGLAQATLEKLVKASQAS